MTFVCNRMRNSSGLTLVELLVAMAIGLILLGGIYQVFVSSTSAYSRNENMSRLQENSRFVAQILKETVSGAGFLGCSQDLGGFQSIIRDSAPATDPLIYNYLQAVYGLEWTGAAWSDDAGPVDPTVASPVGMGLDSPINDSDILVIRHVADVGAVDLQADMAGATAPINVGAGIAAISDAIATATRPPRPLLITDCEGASMFVVSAYDGAGNINFDGTIPGSLPVELNYLTAGQTWNTPTSFARAYGQDAQIFFPQTTIYFVRNNPANVPALYRKIGFNQIEELVEGVETMQVLYGIDTSGNRAADDYVDANVITDWNEVISVRIGLLLQAPNDNLRANVVNRGYIVNEEPVNRNDQRSRTVVNMTIGLRNHLR